MVSQVITTFVGLPYIRGEVKIICINNRVSAT